MLARPPANAGSAETLRIMVGFAEVDTLDTWGFCPHCARWFYLEADTGRCPVCQADPQRVEKRGEPTPSGD